MTSNFPPFVTVGLEPLLSGSFSMPDGRPAADDAQDAGFLRSSPGPAGGFPGSAGAVLSEQVVDRMKKFPFLGFVRAKNGIALRVEAHRLL
jgi:hypothetical protein